MTYTLSTVLFPILIGFFSIFVYSWFVAKKKTNLGGKPSKYESKLPKDYTKNQKMFTLLIACILIAVGFLALNLALNGKTGAAGLVMATGLVAWRMMISIGNKIT